MPDEKVDHQLDLIGKVCPYPTVKTNFTLKKMATGEVLEVITDSTEKSPFSVSSFKRLRSLQRR
jgi:TusA-related sulfurtransferase